jgi:acyl carrier protein
MPDLDDRLQRCVLYAFPALTAESLDGINIAQLAASDSLAAVSLGAILGQEFGVDLDMDDLLAMESLDALRARVARGVAQESRDAK